MEPDAEGIAERLQVTRIALVTDVLHTDMQRLYLESWVVDLGTLSQEFCQQE